MHLSPTPPPPLALAVRSKAVVLLLLNCCLLSIPLWEFVIVLCFVVRYFWFCNHLDGEERAGCFLLRRYFFFGSFMFLFCLVFAMSLCASVYMCIVVTCWERADLLALVCGVNCEFVTFPLVSWVRCGTWLYRFLIFAPLLCLVCLPGVWWLVCDSSSRCHGFVCSLWMWYFLIIPTYYFCI